ncbi:MAG TPA: DUF1573 domain-containing protein [Chitinophagaceae bacterium]
MKQLIVLTLLCISLSSFAQTKNDIRFAETKHVFGKVKQKVPATYTFTFQNLSSSRPLIVETATAECGCTTPEYPKAPIGKGKSGSIKVTYNAETIGAFTKTVTVKFANITEPVILTISGEVVAATR